MRLMALWAALALLPLSGFGQAAERPRPEAWKALARGGRFADLFLPMKGERLSSDTWGAKGVVPRFVDNGIEDRVWSYWGGNILRGEDGRYHLMVAAWLEHSPRGHMEWGNSYVLHAMGERPEGPFKVRDVVGKGHNPVVFRVADGRYVLYVIGGRYVAPSLNGPWTWGTFDFDPRGRRIIEGLSNLTFARREDGSFLMVCRGGGVWVSRDGLSPYRQLTDRRVYPAVEGNFEDPVIWRDNVQYHLVVNDWYGRVAYHLRSPDGFHWVTDPGEAYLPGIATHPDGRKEEWFKYERPQVFQDAHGRAVQMNFAVVDVPKNNDKGQDNHSSKNITLPLEPGRLLEWLPAAPDGALRLKVLAEPGFLPKRDLALASLRFGANDEVNFGRGAPVLASEADGDNLILTFDAKAAAIGPDEFAPKLLGHRTNGSLIHGHVRNPVFPMALPLLSAEVPKCVGGACEVEVENFGLATSPAAEVRVEIPEGKGWRLLAQSFVPTLQPYASATLRLEPKGDLPKEFKVFRVTLLIGGKPHATFERKK